MQRHTNWISFLVVVTYFGVSCQAQCGKKENLIPCLDHGDETRSSICTSYSKNGQQCCFRPNQKPSCVIDTVATFRRSIKSNNDLISQFGTFVQSTGAFDKPSSTQINQAVSSLPEANTDQAKRQLGNVRPYKSQAGRRSLTFAFAALSGGDSFLESLLFPKCPVHVKYCYRTHCGDYYDPLKEADAKSCLSDPTCCYDYQLAFLKKLVGVGFMEDTPVCYYGPTSNQWKFITGFFRPWNPWYTNFILDAFPNVFDTSAFDSVSQFACRFNTLKKAYPVGERSKLECSLVSGCWDESQPAGSQCFMASDFAQNLFGNIPGVKKEVYPSLFTNDPRDTQCSSNWFDFGPKAYRRLPCGIGPAPDSFLEKITKWCPINDCCLNYASLATSGSSATDLLLLNRFTGQGSGSLLGLGSIGRIPSLSSIPGLGGSSPNTLLAYLSLGSSASSSSLSDLFCPYRNILSGSSLFPDLSEFTDGCCEIPDCYHKSKLRRTLASWGEWTLCSNQCGAGTQSRQCLRNKQPVQSFECGGGQSSKTCEGDNCHPPPWTAWSACSVTCGVGERTRRCFYQGREVSPNSCRNGQAREQCFQAACPTLPRAAWTAWSACSVACGTGQRTRECLVGGQLTAPSNCGFGPATEQCVGNNRPVYSWSQWSACSVTCESGIRTRTCLDSCNQAPSFQCGSGSAQENCYEGPCPTPAKWGKWRPLGGCSLTCGRGIIRWRRLCLSNGQEVNDSLCQGTGFGGSAQAPCNTQECPISASWSDWQDMSQCEATCGTMRIKKQMRNCVGSDGSSRPQFECDGASKREILAQSVEDCFQDCTSAGILQCNFPDCFYGQ